jgi:hypothetical protein
MQALGAMSGMEGMNVMGDLGGISQDMSLEDGDYRDEYDDQAFADDSLGLSDAPGGGGGGGGGGNRVRRHGKGSRYGRGKGFQGGKNYGDRREREREFPGERGRARVY